jgi:TM2 domain-containing membrane protein YozV
MKLADKYAGKKIRCPKCKEVIRVEGETVEASPTSPATSKPAAKPTSKPAVDSEEWYLQTEDGETYGPIPRAELDEWHEEGRISAECQLLKDGTDQWQWASDIYSDLEEESGEAPSEEDSPFGGFGGATSTPSATTTSTASKSTKSSGSTGEVGDKSKLVAGLLALFLGNVGVHRFYLGYTGMGVAMLCTCGGCGFWSLIEAIMIFTGKFNEDASGKLLKD